MTTNSVNSPAAPKDGAFSVLNPWAGGVAFSVHPVGIDQVGRTVQAAKAAFRQFIKTPAHQRASWLNGAASAMEKEAGAFPEHLVYDNEGQLLTGSFADHLMPAIPDFPNIRSITVELKPCPNNPFGAKGAGEGGLIPVGGLMANAIADALSHLNFQPMELPLSPPKIWQLVEETEAARAATSSFSI